jgi:hypothetical protein
VGSGECNDELTARLEYLGQRFASQDGDAAFRCLMLSSDMKMAFLTLFVSYTYKDDAARTFSLWLGRAASSPLSSFYAISRPALWFSDPYPKPGDRCNVVK